MTTEIQVVLPAKEQALEVFKAEGGLDPFLLQIEEQALSFVSDVSSKQGRKDIKDMAAKVRKSKSAIESIRKELAAELKELPKKVDKEGKRARDFLEALEEKVYAPLAEYEAIEAARVAVHQEVISTITSIADLASSECVADVKASLKALKEIVIDASLEEFEDAAKQEKLKAIGLLQEKMEQAEEYEAKEAERLRIAEEDRKAEIATAVERAREEEQAQAALRELQLTRKAEEDRKRAEQAEDELKRQEELQAKKEKEAAEKENASKERKREVNQAIVKELVDLGVDEGKAKQVVIAVVQGRISNLKVMY